MYSKQGARAFFKTFQPLNLGAPLVKKSIKT